MRAPLTRRIASALAALASVAAFAGCGGDGGDGGGEETSTGPLELAAALPAEAGVTVAVDFDAVRSSLDLGEDFDVAALSEGDENSGLLISSYASSVLPQVRAYAATFSDDDPVLEAVDGSRISGAAAVFGSPVTAIVATDQPFDEISESLLDAGFEEVEDGVLASPQDVDPSVDVVADMGDGRIVLSDEEEAAEAAIAGEDAGPASAELLDTVDGPLRVGLVPPPEAQIGCITGYAQGEDPGAGTGSLRIEVDEEPDPSLVEIDALGPIAVAERPVADGDAVELGYSFALDESPGGIALPAIARAAIGEIYGC